MKFKYSIKAHSLFLLAVVAVLNFLGVLILRSASNMDAAIVSMVTQGVTEERRASFLREVQEKGSTEYVAVYQQIYDRWQGE